MTKIKLPLRVDECNDRYRLLDQRGNPICSGFHDPETAQLFVDCFEVLETMYNIPDGMTVEFRHKLQDTAMKVTAMAERMA